ncbi:polysaccharide deacetylase family protein [Limibaculum sp. FT325]|uniref:polysaccharide deacetylase family protein n=1 Tax=Thermohalobaculum sediminis TaxID=2939436 RepID=UPI0020BDAB6C|nr:polysaccharide deacetylase family protein [Limibaculum sediminis]MCL5778987.1 polysaccharide deacetylase family protein [Limibaculum sediminis]
MTGPTRDLIGYADAPPPADWPGGARVAVNFCINFEEGGERSILEGDAQSETRISDVVVPPVIGGRDLNIEHSYEYGSRVGYWRLLRAFMERGLPATVNLVGRAGELTPQPLQAMIDAGFDLHPHGWRWIDYAKLSRAEEAAMIAKSIAQVERLTGERPLGYYAGLPSINTYALAAEAGFLYSSDVYNDDLPYWSPDHPRLLMIPYSLDTNDSRFARDGGGYVLGEQFTRYVCDTFDQLYAEGGERPAMMSVGLHARLIGRPGRIGALHRILDHIAGHDRVWIARRDDIARHWQARHPDERAR